MNLNQNRQISYQHEEELWSFLPHNKYKALAKTDITFLMKFFIPLFIPGLKCGAID